MEEKLHSEISTSKTRKPISSQARDIILNVYRFMVTAKLKHPIKVTAEACGISCRTIHRIIKEKSLGLRPESPGKKRPNRKPTVTLVDDAAKCTLRHLIYGAYKEGKVPTAKSLLVQARNVIEFKGQKTSLIKVIKSMGFKFIKDSGRKILVERVDIVAWRRSYLRQIRDNNALRMPRPVVYVYETILSVIQVPEKILQDDSTSNRAKIPPSKVIQFAVCNVGMKSGYLSQASSWLHCQPKQDGSPDTMNAGTYREWFENLLLPNLPLNSFIVLESVPHHNILIDEGPTKSAIKSDIRKWLTQNHIPFGMEMGKSELLTLVQNANLPGHYVIDNLAETLGHKVVRLPPGHCDLNPMEFIGAKTKTIFETNTATTTISDINEVESLWNSALQQITVQEWDECYAYVESVAEQYCDQDDFFQAHNCTKKEKGCKQKLPVVSQPPPTHLMAANVHMETFSFNDSCS